MIASLIGKFFYGVLLVFGSAISTRCGAGVVTFNSKWPPRHLHHARIPSLTIHLSVHHPDLFLIPKHPTDLPFLALTDSSKSSASTTRTPSSTLKISASGMRIGFWIGIMIPTRCLTMICESSSLSRFTLPYFVFVSSCIFIQISFPIS